MKNLLQKWRGSLATAAALAAAVTATAAPSVDTLGGGPNQSGPGRSGAVDGNTLTFAKFRNPYAGAFDTNGNLLITDFGNGRIRKITKPGSGESVTTTLIGGLRAPSSVAVNASNIIYVLTQGDGRLRRFDASGELLDVVSGFRTPTALALGSTGIVYVAELNGRIHRLLPDGTSEVLNFPPFRRPRGLALTRGGLLAVTESSGHAVQIVNPDTGEIVATIGGTRGFADGAADVARFNQPYGIAPAPNGSLVVADRSNHRLRVISTNNVVSTLYGLPAKEWANTFPGWMDGVGGDEGVAATRLPTGVVVDGNGNVYNTESFWNLIRRVTDTGLEFTGTGSGVSTNVVTIGTNSVTVVGTNTISLGFESGEASSDYVGAAGQTFYAPVTLSLAPGQPVYSWQMGLSATGETGLLLDPNQSRFISMLLQPVAGVPNAYFPIEQNYEFLNSSLNLLGVGWLERQGQTNLYPANAQDLVTFSLAKNTLFNKSGNKVVLGAYGFRIPDTATPSDTLRIAIRNPSGSSDGISQPMPLRVPTDNGLGAGTLNTIKRVTLASRQYLVGDSTPFRWLNAGDFGDFNLVNSDVMDLFQTVEYGLNAPVVDSDLFNALDSSDGSSPSVDFGDDISINNVIGWDNSLNVDDLWVTFRRSLDPSLKWFARYWSNGVRQVVEVPNTLLGGFETTAAAPLKNRAKNASANPRPTARLISGDALATPGAQLEIPVQLSITPGYAARVLLVSVSFQALDGSPAVTQTIQLQTSPALQNPEFSHSRSAGHYAAAWLNHNIPGLAGDSLMAILTVNVPANAGPRAAYRVAFNHFSASPNGVALFAASTSPGLILLSDRSASTWNDGISDEWRLRYFGSIYAPESAVNADADGDGVLNVTEYQNGTDPTDVTSY